MSSRFVRYAVSRKKTGQEEKRGHSRWHATDTVGNLIEQSCLAGKLACDTLVMGPKTLAAVVLMI